MQIIKEIILFITILSAYVHANNLYFYPIGGFHENGVLVKQYFLSKEKFMWSEGRNLCAKYNLRFAAFTRLSETNSVLKLVTDYSDSNKDKVGPIVHINGKTDVAGSRRNFFWVPAPRVKVDVDYWAPGQPNNLGGEQFCLAAGRWDFPKEKSYRFYDIDCNSEKMKFQVLCHFAASPVPTTSTTTTKPPPTTTTKAPSTSTTKAPTTSTTTKASTTSTTTTKASTTSTTTKASTTSTTTTKPPPTTTTKAPSTSTTKAPTTSTTTKAPTTSTTTKAPTTSTQAPTTPTTSTSTTSKPTTTTQPPTTTPLPPKFYPIGSSNTKSYFVSEIRLPWIEANEYCCKNGMKFASLSNVGETNAVLAGLATFWKSNTDKFTGNVHLNAITNVLASKKSFHWANAPWVNLENEKWGSGEPNNAVSGKEYCLTTYSSNDEIVLNDNNCETTLHQVLCEKKK